MGTIIILAKVWKLKWAAHDLSNAEPTEKGLFYFIFFPSFNVKPIKLLYVKWSIALGGRPTSNDLSYISPSPQFRDRKNRSWLEYTSILQCSEPSRHQNIFLFSFLVQFLLERGRRNKRLTKVSEVIRGCEKGFSRRCVTLHRTTIKKKPNTCLVTLVNICVSFPEHGSSSTVVSAIFAFFDPERMLQFKSSLFFFSLYLANDSFQRLWSASGFRRWVGERLRMNNACFEEKIKEQC